MAYTDKLLSFDFIERKLNADTNALRAFRINRDGQREAWLSDVVFVVRPSARRLAGWMTRIEATELIAKG